MVSARSVAQAKSMLRWAMLRVQAELLKRESQVMRKRNTVQARIDASRGQGMEAV